jgi:hypothetical protein
MIRIPRVISEFSQKSARRIEIAKNGAPQKKPRQRRGLICVDA